MPCHTTMLLSMQFIYNANNNILSYSIHKQMSTPKALDVHTWVHTCSQNTFFPNPWFCGGVDDLDCFLWPWPGLSHSNVVAIKVNRRLIHLRLVIEIYAPSLERVTVNLTTSNIFHKKTYSNKILVLLFCSCPARTKLLQ